MTPAEPGPQTPTLGPAALFWRFLRFGALAFGGPVAQIAMIRQALVAEERWISKDQFNRLVAVMQVLPGPEAHELCVHLGVRAGGRLGGLAAGLGFMLPGFGLMLALGWLYTQIPIAGTGFGALFLGVQAAVIALIIRAVHRIGEHILANAALWAIALAVAGASWAGASFWLVLPAAGLAYALWAGSRRALAALVVAAAAGLALALPQAGFTPVLSAATAPTALALFLAGLKGGLLTFGGAYTSIPFVRADTVGKGWISDAAFLDGLGLSGLLPAPLVIFVTFVGFVVAGLPGALAITAGMFLPAFAFSLIFYERLETVVDDPRLTHALEGVAAGVVGLITVTLVDLARTAAAATPDLAISIAITAICLALLYRWKNKLAPLAAVGIGAAIGLPML